MRDSRVLGKNIGGWPDAVREARGQGNDRRVGEKLRKTPKHSRFWRRS